MKVVDVLCFIEIFVLKLIMMMLCVVLLMIGV